MLQELGLVGERQDEVAMGVNVDKPRGNDTVRDIDDAISVGVVDPSDPRNSAVVDGDVGLEPGFPVPSTTLPFLSSSR